MSKTKVHLNVYDLHQANKYGYFFGLGAYHSGVEVNGKEYCFGGHEYSCTGVYENTPKTANGARFRESVFLGETTCSQNQIDQFIIELSAEFIGNTYHPFTKNCNSFSNALCLKLLNAPIPSYVNRLAYVGSVFSCFLPPNGLEMLGIGIPTSNETTSTTPSTPINTTTTTTTASNTIRVEDNRFSFEAFSGTGVVLEGTSTPIATVEETAESKRERNAMAAYKRMSHNVL